MGRNLQLRSCANDILRHLRSKGIFSAMIFAVFSSPSPLLRGEYSSNSSFKPHCSGQRVTDRNLAATHEFGCRHRPFAIGLNDSDTDDSNPALNAKTFRRDFDYCSR